MTAQDPKVTVLDPIDGIRVVVREPSWACQNCGHEFGTVLRMRGRKNSLGLIRCEQCGAQMRVLRHEDWFDLIRQHRVSSRNDAT
jgi:uncharacterized Zn finger protein